jgi:dTDP-glucose 4,6-dehydratase
VRDWLHVSDHCRALDLLIERGVPGEVYNVGGGNEVTNLDLTHTLISLVGKTDALIRRVEDRKGHDRRYSVSTDKLKAMGWAPQVAFEEGLQETVEWYRKNEWWWRPVKERDAEYKAYIAQQYGNRPSQ